MLSSIVYVLLKLSSMIKIGIEITCYLNKFVFNINFFPKIAYHNSIRKFAPSKCCLCFLTLFFVLKFDVNLLKFIRNGVNLSKPNFANSSFLKARSRYFHANNIAKFVAFFAYILRYFWEDRKKKLNKNYHLPSYSSSCCNSSSVTIFIRQSTSVGGPAPRERSMPTT